MTSLGRRPKRTHRKSRAGCASCKLRKVKCDEARPECANCARFSLPCSFSATPGVAPAGPDATTRPAEASAVSQLPFLPRRGRGRPRRDWAAGDAGKQAQPSQSQSQSQAVPPSNPDTSLNIAQAELLHQFIICTGPSLASSDDDPIARFWTRNVTPIGLSNPSVLHLCLSLAAYHLAYQTEQPGHTRSHYQTLAKHHFDLGLVLANEALAAMSVSNCGAVYLSTMLVCFCSFAAGPVGSGDLLLCHLNNASPHQWLPLARGARLLRQLYDSDVLFAGLMEPLGPAGAQPEDPRPTCACEGFARVDWVQPMERLRNLVAEQQGPDREVYMSSFDIIASIYEATFGDDDGRVKCSMIYKMILVWPYMIDDSFLTCLQKMDAVALMLVAFYAPLLKTMKRSWYMDGWAEHILTQLQPKLTESFSDLLQWPIDAIKVI
ncbi:hypothetical protein B0J13DRAFT_133830 [Dactylonectria estremocensis]|uniref:Zn(2)-C6 fungal-type domain-containing protein n=1 Tax=Dactylonectria estremocensis TaxID=1079267 RepID=A0A9P9IP91_9HYPO|nr:hypothetical protein B0J13DRAFT_133830 [Dactylonectria estremocensis]